MVCRCIFLYTLDAQYRHTPANLIVLAASNAHHAHARAPPHRGDSLKKLAAITMASHVDAWA